MSQKKRMKKGRTASTAQPFKPVAPTLQIRKYLPRHSTTATAPDAHTAALARVLGMMARYPAIKVLGIHHRHGNTPLVVVEYGLLAWCLPGVRTGIYGRGDGRTERYEALVDGVRIGWEFNPVRHPRHFN